MSDTLWQLAAMAIYLIAMIAIGFYAYRTASTDLDGYMLGGRDLSPRTAALSAGASDMSGWLLLGLPGAIYVSGLSESWIAIGLVIGAYVNWRMIAPRLRAYTEVSNNSITIPSFLENRLKDGTRSLRMFSGLIIMVFFTFYVSSGMVAGGKFFESSFGLNYYLGMILITAIVVLYTLVGGFLAVSLTDVVQGVMMMLALLAVPVVTLIHLGGFGNTASLIRDVDPTNLSLVGKTTAIGVVSAVAWGLGYFGQPHILVRFMALRSSGDAKAGRRWGVGWMLICVIGAVATALVGIAYFQQQGNPLSETASETVFLELAQIFFNPFIAGFVLAALLAAIMSTISSQLLVTSSAIVEDVFRTFKRETTDKTLVFLGRAGVVLVSIIAALIALNRNSSILELVGFAWAGFGAAFGPVVILSMFWRKLTTAGALSSMVGGAVVVGVWGQVAFFQDTNVYEIIPGFIVSMVLAVVVSAATYRKNDEIEAEFDATISRVAEGNADRTTVAAGSEANR